MVPEIRQATTRLSDKAEIECRPEYLFRLARSGMMVTVRIDNPAQSGKQAILMRKRPVQRFTIRYPDPAGDP